MEVVKGIFTFIILALLGYIGVLLTLGLLIMLGEVALAWYEFLAP